jgi:glycine oxidase
MLKPNIAVTGFRSERGRLTAVLTSQGDLPADQCVVCAGAWTAELLATTGLALPIKPIRGQMLLYRGRPDQLRHIIVRNYRYLIPRRDGYILAGSTLEDVGFDPSTTSAAKAEIHADAIRIMPALADCPLEAHWAGLRPGTPEGAPYIGEHPAITGLFVCAGHHRNGFALAPASARLCTDLMLNRKPLLPPAPYRLDYD